MFLPLSALLDPIVDDLDFGICQFKAGRDRRHAKRRLRRDSLHNNAGRGVVLDDRSAPLSEISLGCSFAVQTKRNLLRYCIGSMACEALIGKNRSNVAVEIYVGSFGGEADSLKNKDRTKSTQHGYVQAKSDT